MSKRVFFRIVFILSPLFIFSLQSEILKSSSGVTFEFEFRTLQPGEIIKVALRENPSVKEAIIRFIGKEYSLKKRNADTESFVFIDLDLALEPKIYIMKIYVKKISGEWEYVQKEIPVTAKEFPLKQLWVKEEFVTPPPEFQDRIERESEIVNLVYSVVTPEWLGEGKFILPSSGEIVPNFGERRIFNNKPRSPHSGIDISAPYGTPSKASNSGKVVLARDLYFAGKTVIVDHGLGLFTIYCHFSQIKVKRGEFVKKGAVIGEVGATGRVTGPHLHWGVKLLKSRIDPLSLLSLPLD
ncbi:MAG: M23 family metallopeptidase [Candidatus Aminicenantaceae bacterium]